MCEKCVEIHLQKILESSRRSFFKAGKVLLELPTASLCDRLSFVQRRRYKRLFVYPAPTAKSSTKFTILVRILRLIVDNFCVGKKATVRDIFYQDVNLFRTQKSVVAAIDQICRTLHVPRRLLGIIPSPNGLIAGDLTVVFSSGAVVEIDRINSPHIIPVGSQVFHISVKKQPKFILVIEKEAVFSHLCKELPEALLVTGRGFPDHYTRLFLKALVDAMPSVPVYGLVDADVHGILIMKTYSLGSDTMVEEQLPIPQLQYLGVSLMDYEQGVVNSTWRDKKLAMSTLKKAWIKHDKYTKWRVELQRGLFFGKKAEMNVLDAKHLQALARYVRLKVKPMELKPESKIPHVPKESKPHSVQGPPHVLRRSKRLQLQR